MIQPPVNAADEIAQALFADEQAEMEQMSIARLAHLIRKDWGKPCFGAVPYLQAMAALHDVDDPYGADDGRSIVLYFLANASAWRGARARDIKTELNRRIKRT